MLSMFGLLVALFGACCVGELFIKLSYIYIHTRLDYTYQIEEPIKKKEIESKPKDKELEDEFLKEDTKIKRVEVEL